MNTTAKVILFPQPTKQGYPLKIRIINNRKSIYIGLKYYLTESQKDRYWNDTKKELRKSYPFYEQVQKELEKEKNQYGLNKSEPPKLIINNNLSFLDYFKNYNLGLEKNGQFGLLQRSVSSINHIKEYLETIGKTDLQFKEVNIDFLNNLQFYMADKKIAPITQRGYFEKIRTVINTAIKQDKFNPPRHPFAGFEFKKVVVQPKCLEPEEFNFLKDKSYTIDVEFKPTLLKFLFQYYAYGMRVSDLLLLKWSNIYEHGTRLKYQMFKTKHQLDISLNNALLNILYEFCGDKPLSLLRKEYFKYKNERPNEYYEFIRRKIHSLSIEDETKDKRIFSNIPELEGKQFYSRIQMNTAIYNKSLKDLSKELNKNDNFSFYLTSHMARHTFAYLSMLNGDSVYYISQALNHKSIKTTEVYLRGFKSRQLDGKFYKKEPTANEKATVDNKLKEYIATADFETKKKLLEFLGAL